MHLPTGFFANGGMCRIANPITWHNDFWPFVYAHVNPLAPVGKQRSPPLTSTARRAKLGFTSHGRSQWNRLWAASHPLFKAGKLIIIDYFLKCYDKQHDTKNDRENSRLSCPKCSTSFAYRQGLNGHWKSVHKQPLDTLSAPTCDKKGKIKSSDRCQKLSRFSCPYSDCNEVPFGSFTAELTLQGCSWARSGLVLRW